MNKPIDVFVLRHALPLDNGLDDPGIGEEQIPFIRDTAATIAATVEEDTEFTIYTSPSLAATQTANVLWYNEALKMTRGINPAEHDNLAPSSDLETTRARWPSVLQEISNRAILRTAADKNTGLIIVTHKSVMHAFPVDGLLPHTDHLALNHFKDYQDSPSDEVMQTSRRTDRLFHNGRALQDIVRDFIRLHPEILDEDTEHSPELLAELDKMSADLRAVNQADLDRFNSSKQ